jgi:predicted nucleic acid-binding protein
MSWEDIRDALAAIRILCEPATPLSVKTHEAALDMASQYGYQIYDASIVAAALDAQCDILYTEDM